MEKNSRNFHFLLLSGIYRKMEKVEKFPSLCRTKKWKRSRFFSISPTHGKIILKFGPKRNVRLKIVASGCDQCVWPVGVVAGCGHWVGHQKM